MTIKGLQKRLHVDGSHVWYIDKRVKRYGRLCESTGTDNREEAERYLLHRLHELREVLIYGERPTRTFQDAIQKYESTFAKKKSIRRDSAALQEMVPLSDTSLSVKSVTHRSTATDERRDTYRSEHATKKCLWPAEC